MLVRANGFAYLSGQGPIDPDSGDVVRGDVVVQTSKTLDNIRRILAAEGLSMDHVVKANVYLADIADFDAMSKEYRTHWRSHLPARTTVGGADLWGGIKVEIEVVAVLDLET
jgi:2-iminobutanoate/2-iminopropanoate deaminase